jgi:hypothetical protein
MYHIYDNGKRITITPVSYNFVLTNLFPTAKIDTMTLSSLKPGEEYNYHQYKFVRQV